MNAHAWNEFWLDEAGWVPVDASLGWAMKHRPWSWLGQGLPMRSEAYFARLDGARIGFSYGPDVEPVPQFDPVSVADEGGFRLRAAGRELRWGIDTLDGRLPYLQPAYPRFRSSPGRRQDLLGRWRVAELGVVGALVRAGVAAQRITVLALVAFLVLSLAGLSEPLETFALFVLVASVGVSVGVAVGVAVLRRRRTAAG
jgi:hypothetical protein